MKRVLDYGKAATAGGRRVITFGSVSVFAGLTAAGLMAIGSMRPKIFDGALFDVQAFWLALVALILVGILTGCIGCTIQRGRRLSIFGIILNCSIPVVIGVLIWRELQSSW